VAGALGEELAGGEPVRGQVIQEQAIAGSSERGGGYLEVVEGPAGPSTRDTSATASRQFVMCG